MKRKLSAMAADYLANSLKMPKDIVYGNVLVSISGRQEVYIENYRSIIEYTDCALKLQTKNGKLIINGKNIQIDYYTSEIMKITGVINSVLFE